MPFDYDLVILGSTIAAREAAVMARSYGARVAMVAPVPTVDLQWAEDSSLYSYALVQMGQMAERMQQAPQFGLGYQQGGAGWVSLNWLDAVGWMTHAIANWQAERSPEALTSLGIEVIFGMGAFHSQPQLGLKVGDRLLISRRYLIALGACAVSTTHELAPLHPLTLETLWQKQLALPCNLVVLGEAPIALELAQALNRFGANVTLVTQHPYLLPQEDGEAAQLIQAQLEAEGIRIVTQTAAQPVQPLANGKGVQIGEWAIEADAILSTHQAVPLEPLNLQAAGVRWHERGVRVNRKLQTTNPRIYACGDALGGYSQAHAQYEAAIAVRNALFIATTKTNRLTVPFTLLTDPPLARVGLTEAQAKRRYGRSLHIVKQTVKSVAKAQLLDQTTGFCKLLVRYNGEIVGAHWVGAGADEGIGAIALAMTQRLRLNDLAHVTAAPAYSAVIQQAAHQWQCQQVNPRWQDWAEAWFNFRRQ